MTTPSLPADQPTQTLTIELDQGYEDVFSHDLGWEASFAGFQGAWERGDPIGQASPGGDLLLAPEDDTEDLGNECYVTGNSESINGGFLFGTASLESPVFDVATYVNPSLSYEYWYWASDFGGNPSGEMMFIELSNGDTTVILDTIINEFLVPNVWQRSGEIIIQDYLTPTDNMSIIITSSEAGFDDAVESGFDNFVVFESETVATREIDQTLDFVAIPNPSSNQFELLVSQELLDRNVELHITDIRGVVISSMPMTNTTYSIGLEWNKGLYFAQMVSSEEVGPVLKLIKQ